MASFVKFEPGAESIANKLIDFFGTTDTFKLAIHTDAPTVATDDELADLTQVTGTGYTAGGEDTQNDATRSGGTVTFTWAGDIVWTATAADWIAARYFAMHDDTATTDRLISDWDYGANFTLGNGETMTADPGANVFTFA